MSFNIKRMYFGIFVIFAVEFSINNNMIVSLALLIAGIVMIIVGADKLTDGAAAIAARYGISSLVIGLTVVAFGSSMPEFVISFISSLKGSTEIAIGNVVGSNIFNILFIVGCTAAVFPIKVTNRTVYKDLPFAVMSSLVLFVVACDAFIDDAQWNVITRSDGLLLICFFVVFMFYTLATARSSEGASEEPVAPESIMPVWKSVLYVLLGLAGLIFGGDFFVDGACDVARLLGVSESVIALTLVSGGTSLPELAASLMAARKRDSGMAIGNVIGSVVFNAFWILGASATVSQLPLGHITVFDLFTLLVASVVMWILARTGKIINRVEGGIMVLMYVGYIAYLLN